MINGEIMQQFWDFVDIEIDGMPFVLASEDPDLVGLFEIRLTGETDKVGIKRAQLLAELAETDTGRIYSEIQQGYGLSASQLVSAIELCRRNVELSARANLEWSV